MSRDNISELLHDIEHAAGVVINGDTKRNMERHIQVLGDALYVVFRVNNEMAIRIRDLEEKVAQLTRRVTELDGEEP